MRHVQLEYLHIEGFRSIIEPNRFSFSSNGIYQIIGNNGAGKTSVFEALSWGLYGKNLKNSPVANLQTFAHLQPVDFKGTKVQIGFAVDGYNYTVVRTIGYTGMGSVLELYEDDTLLEGMRKKDTQANIESILGVPYNMFINTVLFGQRMLRLSQMTAVEQRTFFNQMFELDYLKHAKDIARQTCGELVNKIDGANNDILHKQKLYEALQSRLDSIEQYYAAFEAKRYDRVKALEAKQAAKNAELAEVRAEKRALTKKFNALPQPGATAALEAELDIHKAKFREVCENIASCNATEKEENGKANRADKRIAALELQIAEYPENCHACGQELDKVARATALERLAAEIAEHKEILEAAKDKLLQLAVVRADYIGEQAFYEALIKDLQGKIAEHKKSRADLNELAYQIKSCEPRMKAIQERIDELDEEIKAAWNEKPVNQGEDAIKEEQATVYQDIAKLQKEVQTDAGVLKVYDWWSRVGFGANGIAMYIIQNRLALLNQHIAEFAQKLGISVMIDVNLDGATKNFEIHCLLHDEYISYDDLSGGEKTRVDLALTFGLYRLLSSSEVFINALILDEAFAGLDEQGLDSAYEMLSAFAEDRGVYIVTFNPLFNPVLAKEIEIQKTHIGTIIIQ